MDKKWSQMSALFAVIVFNSYFDHTYHPTIVLQENKFWGATSNQFQVSQRPQQQPQPPLTRPQPRQQSGPPRPPPPPAQSPNLVS